MSRIIIFIIYTLNIYISKINNIKITRTTIIFVVLIFCYNSYLKKQIYIVYDFSCMRSQILSAGELYHFE
nr:MAG TPA: hypothetical protein [Caudoviricetes sp.]